MAKRVPKSEKKKNTFVFLKMNTEVFHLLQMPRSTAMSQILRLML